MIAVLLFVGVAFVVSLLFFLAREANPGWGDQARSVQSKLCGWVIAYLENGDWA